MKKSIFLLLFLWACTQADQETKRENAVTMPDTLVTEIFTDVLHFIPAVIELELVLNKTGLTHDKTALAPLSFQAISEAEKAFYMGAYSVDLGYLYVLNDKNYWKYYEKIDCLAENFGLKGQKNC